MRKKENITVFISDFRYTYFSEQTDISQSFYDSLDLPEGVIVNGYVKEPDILYQLLLDNMKLRNFKLRQVNILIHDQNLLIRNLLIKKTDLQRKSIEQYLHEQTDKKVYFPFEKAAISHFIKKEDEETVNALALITDEDLLHDYYDIFEKLGAKEVTFDLPSLSLYELYKDVIKSDVKDVMIVTLYHKLVAIQIFSNHLPSFQMIEECDGKQSNYTRILETYIERIANYYRYNLTKGKYAIKDIVIFNLSTNFTKSDILNDVIPSLSDFNASLFDIDQINHYHKEMPISCFLPFASIKTQNAQFQLPFEFKLERIKRVNIYGNYLMVIAFFLFATISLLYIPFYVFNEDISNQQNINQSLENILNNLKRDQEEDSIYSDVQISYNNIYQNLTELEISYKNYVDDLSAKLNLDITLNQISINSSDQSITLVISSQTTSLYLDEYVLDIYEAYGISDYEEEDGRWMTQEPEKRYISELVLEVKIYHA